MRVSELRAPSFRSLAGLYRTANWWERHVYDLYGIRFALVIQTCAGCTCRRIGWDTPCARTTR